MKIWRSHPILLAALIGALIGVISPISILMSREWHLAVLRHHLLLVLWPTSILGFGFNEPNPLLSVFMLTVELISNAMLCACVAAAPVALAFAIRRSFIRPEKPTSLGRIG